MMHREKGHVKTKTGTEIRHFKIKESQLATTSRIQEGAWGRFSLRASRKTQPWKIPHCGPRTGHSVECKVFALKGPWLKQRKERGRQR